MPPLTDRKLLAPSLQMKPGRKARSTPAVDEVDIAIGQNDEELTSPSLCLTLQITTAGPAANTTIMSWGDTFAHPSPQPSRYEDRPQSFTPMNRPLSGNE